MLGSNKAMVREWIILGLSVGVGGHVALGLVLHEPGKWQTDLLGIYGIFIGLSIYVLVQVGRSVWWLFRSDRQSQANHENPID